VGFEIKTHLHTAQARLIFVPKLMNLQGVCFEGVTVTVFQAMTYGLCLQV